MFDGWAAVVLGVLFGGRFTGRGDAKTESSEDASDGSIVGVVYFEHQLRFHAVEYRSENN